MSDRAQEPFAGAPCYASSEAAGQRIYIARKIREARRVVRRYRGHYPWLEGEEYALTALVKIGRTLARTDRRTPKSHNIRLSDTA